MKFPSEDFSVCRVDIIEPIVQEVFELSHDDYLHSVISHPITHEKLGVLKEEIEVNPFLEELVNHLDEAELEEETSNHVTAVPPHPRLLPSIV